MRAEVEGAFRAVDLIENARFLPCTSQEVGARSAMTVSNGAGRPAGSNALALLWQKFEMHD